VRAVLRLKPRWPDLIGAAAVTRVLLGICVLGLSVPKTTAQEPASSSQAGGESKQKPTTGSKYPAELVEQGATLFQQRCAFCHGRDATGGESGPDLTRSNWWPGMWMERRLGPLCATGVRRRECLRLRLRMNKSLL